MLLRYVEIDFKSKLNIYNLYKLTLNRFEKTIFWGAFIRKDYQQ